MTLQWREHFSVPIFLLIMCSVLSGCGPSVDASCSKDQRVRVIVGNVLYTIRDRDLETFTPVDKSTGLVLAHSRDADGRVRRFCQKEGSGPARARAIGISFVRNSEIGKDIKNKSIMLRISAPDSLADFVKPKWPPFKSQEIKKISYRPLQKNRLFYKISDLSLESSMTLVINLKNGQNRELTFSCRWVEASRTIFKKDWIGSCDPFLPLLDGNFLEVSTGGTPEAEPELIGRDIVQGLAFSETLNRTELPK